jgi:hypothetical protein
LYYIADSTLEYLKISSQQVQRDKGVHKGGRVARLALLSSKQGLKLGRGKQQRRGRGLVSRVYHR